MLERKGKNVIYDKIDRNRWRDLIEFIIIPNE